MTTHAIRIHEHGGPDVLKYEETDPGSPGAGEVLVRHEAIGLNFIDIYQRTGLYPLADLPAVLGMEAAGVIEQTSDGVRDFAEGDRVAYAGGPVGAYCERRIMPADKLVPLPDWISSEQAAACMLQGMTAQYLLRDTYPVEENDVILVHAAAGGVGLIMCQWAKALGANVIGTVSTREKQQLAHENGCDVPILYTEQSFVDVVNEVTEGTGLSVVYDSVGRDTFMDSLSCLAPRGLMVSYGQSSGPVEDFNPALLSQHGSLYLTRPSLMDYTAERSELLVRAEELFGVLRDGSVEIEIGQRFALKDAAEAHKALESRQTTGSTILLPETA